MKKIQIIGCLLLGLLVFTHASAARADYNVVYGYGGRDAEYRNAVAMDDWLERGQGAILESPVFADGVRLMGQGGGAADSPGLASAVYHFAIPPWARYLAVTVRYKDELQDDAIAARLWIKSTDTDTGGTVGAGEEAPLYGDTFILRSDRLSETITVPASGHVEEGMAEMHIVAEGNDCIDVQAISVAYLDQRPAITIVHRTHDDYWDLWPRQQYVYHYYYWGPLFWPRTHASYECWNIPQRFYWVTWRPWFRLAMMLPFRSHPWWEPRHYTIIYHEDRRQPLEARRAMLRAHLKEQHEQARIITHGATPVSRTAVRTPVTALPYPSQERRSPKQTEPARTSAARGDRNQTHAPLPGNAPPSQNQKTQSLRQAPLPPASEARVDRNQTKASLPVNASLPSNQEQRTTNQTLPAPRSSEARIDGKQTQAPVPVNAVPSQKQEQRLPNQTQPPRRIEARVDRDQTQGLLKKDPVPADKGGEQPVIHTQATTVNGNQVSAKPDAPFTRSSHDAMHAMPKDQAQTPMAKQTAPSNARAGEVAPAPAHYSPTPGGKGNQGQPVQGPAKIGQEPKQQPQPDHASQQLPPDRARQQQALGGGK